MKKGVWGMPMVMLGLWVIIGEIWMAILGRDSFQLREWGIFAAAVILEIVMISAGIKLLKRTKVLGPLFCIMFTYIFTCRILYLPLKEMYWQVFLCSAIMVFGMTVAFSFILRR
jgi:hypothetical protein